jgi:hypothetical protein
MGNAMKKIWFFLRYGCDIHDHHFIQSGSDTFVCNNPKCNAWYGEQNWI